jgi:hypothetical protein
MALISFLAGENFTINNLNGSGIGFYGAAGFGATVNVGEYQGRSFITNSAGTAQGPEVDNVKFLNAGSGILGQTGSGIALTAIPNYQATLNVRFTDASTVATQNVSMRIFDRADINNDPSGVTCKVAEIIHPGITQTNDGSGDIAWVTPHGSGVTVPFIDSPGISGLRPDGPNTTDVQHDWYAAIAASPDSVGSKTQFGLYFTLEYL